ncbi:hypothetical protein M011DRAFT_464217 [Sporormia fimetaria CBS 119925]|uniref:Uncharacterized protein n=1 Tax=Sporormia fimetaria CBS 119925 TaxID=1340428 RepID=A0A6A6VQJ1_9PLEO|nr:hypothetical protein M011DRAFT_464217 [Sporormia fimetaria CBS 119925]
MASPSLLPNLYIVPDPMPHSNNSSTATSRRASHDGHHHHIPHLHLHLPSVSSKLNESKVQAKAVEKSEHDKSAEEAIRKYRENREKKGNEWGPLAGAGKWSWGIYGV